MSKRIKKKKSSSDDEVPILPQPRSNMPPAPIRMPREFLLMIDKCNKAATSMGIAVDYIRDIAQTLQRQGMTEQRRLDNLEVIAKKYKESKEKKKDKNKTKT